MFCHQYGGSGRLKLGWTRVLGPLPVVEQSSARFWPEPTPLLEEEGNACRDALVAHFADPFRPYRSETHTAFTAHDHPVDAFQVHRPNRPNERLDGEEPDTGIRLPEVLDPGEGLAVLYGDTKPDV